MMSEPEECRRYGGWCIFDSFSENKKRCPLSGMDVDGSLCSSCVDVEALRGMRANIISQLLMAYHDEKKAKEIFGSIMKCIKEW